MKLTGKLLHARQDTGEGTIELPKVGDVKEGDIILVKAMVGRVYKDRDRVEIELHDEVDEIIANTIKSDIIAIVKEEWKKGIEPLNAYDPALPSVALCADKINELISALNKHIGGEC